MNKPEQQFNKFELEPNTNVCVVASLESRYFLKTEQGQYLFLNQDLEQYEEVSEVTIVSQQ